LKLFNKY